MTFPSLRLVLLAGAVALATASPLAAQRGTRAPAKAAAPVSLAGTWSGMATVPLPDTTIVIPVFYTFIESAAGVGGTAMIPGQGSGPISNVVRTGAGIRFRVTVTQPEKTSFLEHDAKLGADGSIEGMVNLDNKPVAKFKVTPAKVTPKK